MKEFTPKIAELITFNPNISRNYVDIFVFEPEREEEALGRLFITSEIENISQKSKEILEAIATIMQTEYYRDPSRNVLESFESALNKTNEIMGDLAEHGEISWVGKLHAAAAVQKNNELHLSITGNASTWLYRDGDITNISQNLSTDRKPSPLAIFINVASGNVKENDKIILTTPELLRYASEEKLKNILQKFPTEFIITRLKNLIPRKNPKAIASLIIEMTMEKVEFKKPMRKLSEILKRKPIETSIETEQLSEEKTSISDTKYKILSGTKKSGEFIKNKVIPSLSKVKDKTFSISKAATQKLKEKEIPRKINETSKKWWKTITEKFNKLPTSSKIFLIISLLLGMILLVTLIYYNTNREKINVSTKKYDGLVQQIKDKENEAEAAIIMKDNDRARNLLKEADDLLEQAESLGFLGEERDNLKNKIQEDYDKLEGINRVKPELVADFSQSDQSIKTSDIIGKDKDMYSFNPDNNAVYKLNIDSKSVETVSSISSNIGRLIYGTHIKSGDLVFYTDTPGIAKLSKEGLSNTEVEFYTQDMDIKDIASYGDKIYLLDAKNNQIYAHSPTLAGYSKGYKWLDENVDLSNATSLAIDGSIYVLRANGMIDEFLYGAKKSFEVKNLPSGVENATQIYTDENSNNIYILEPEKNRILVIEKEGGNFQKQYVLEGVSDLKGLYVMEIDRKMYVLSGTKVYSINLQ